MVEEVLKGTPAAVAAVVVVAVKPTIIITTHLLALHHFLTRVVVVGNSNSFKFNNKIQMFRALTLTLDVVVTID